MTLKSIALSTQVKLGQVEVILVDDGSDEDKVLTRDQLSQFQFPILDCRIPQAKKDWVNPAVAYNFGILHAKGKWVILQNSGVIHSGDIWYDILFTFFLKSLLTFYF